MLPQVPVNDEIGPIPMAKTIHVNPNFNKSSDASKSTATVAQKTHVNPLFLHRIHMNPQFLQKKLLEQEFLRQQLKLKEQSSTAAVTPVVSSTKLESRKIISKSRLRLIREPLIQKTIAKQNPPVVLSPLRATLPISQVARQPLLKLTKRKLVRRAAVTTPMNASSPGKVASVSIGKYKIDNRRSLRNGSSVSMMLAKVRRSAFVGRYALLRSASQQSSTKEKNSNSSSMRSSQSSNRKLELLNINGVLYKSTRNKLQRKDATTSTSITLKGKAKLESPTASIKKSLPGRTLFVRGTKFVLDSQGFKLTRVPSLPSAGSSKLLDSRYPRTPTKQQWQRLDIGGLTYIASKTQNVFVRTGNHLAMAHLNNAKQRSLQLLSRRLVKSNLPCAIFQRVGKCVAFERGRCSKVHDKLQVTICPRFLRGECTNSNCLLSHHVSLFKMPVCKFFLQGLCVRSDCPYLHKKLSQKAEICEEFLRGFCSLAEQCQKRHEFLCPTYERTGKCEASNCVHCKSKKRREQIKEAKARPTKTSVPAKKLDSSRVREENAEPTMRYFNGNSSVKDAPPPMDADDVTSDDADDTNAAAASFLSVRPARPKVGTLPAFIPL